MLKNIPGILHKEGGLHNQLTVDQSFLNSLGNTSFRVYYTMGCGNDNLIGKGSVNVPEPTLMSLFGCGLLGLAFFSKRKCK